MILKRLSRSGLVRLASIGLAAVGPTAVAAAHFIQSIFVLRHLPTAEFGLFAFSVTLAALGWATWGALFCAPFPHLIIAAPAQDRASHEQTTGAANLQAAMLAAAGLGGISAIIGMEPGSAALFATFMGISLVRWFGRAHAYFHNRQAQSVLSDILYSLCLFIAVAWMWRSDSSSLAASYSAMAIAAFAGVLPFGRRYLRAMLGSLNPRSVPDYFSLVRDRVPWSMLSLLCTELTANAHVYLVTFLKGPEAYGPIAATALLLRPMTLTSSSLRDVERPRLAKMAAQRQFRRILRSLLLFRLVLGAAWALTLGATALLFWTDPRLIFPSQYDLDVLRTGAVLWLLVGGVAMLRVPESALLQAMGRFRSLWLANLFAALASLTGVTLLLLLLEPTWSIAGVLVGQVVHAVAATAQSRALRREFRRSQDN